jgi:hypothetical protein
MPTQGIFESTAQIQVIRPVFNTDFETVSFQFIDRTFNFQYLPGQPLDFNENAYLNNLTSLLGFYAYIILAIDYDTFSKMGGKRWVEKAFNIANAAQTAPEPGWRSGDDIRSRYWLMENMLNQQVIPYREGLYDYYRLGLDRFLYNPDKAREKILAFLKKIEEINQLKPGSILVNSFFDVKGDELVNLFSEASVDIKKEVHRILVKVDPARTELYNRLVN